ncbi:MAG: hypothetical protein NT107_04285 [Planctomycetota bacterium]|nr:hypothetical protein [Planctomycetota bacterium]
MFQNNAGISRTSIPNHCSSDPPAAAPLSLLLALALPLALPPSPPLPFVPVRPRSSPFVTVRHRHRRRKCFVKDGSGEARIFVNPQADIDVNLFAIGQRVIITGFSKPV